MSDLSPWRLAYRRDGSASHVVVESGSLDAMLAAAMSRASRDDRVYRVSVCWINRTVTVSVTLGERVGRERHDVRAG